MRRNFEQAQIHDLVDGVQRLKEAAAGEVVSSSQITRWRFHFSILTLSKIGFRAESIDSSSALTKNHPSLLCNNSSPGWFKCSIFPEKSRKDGVIWWTLRPDSVDDSGKNLRVRAKPLLRSKPLLSRTSWNKSCQGSKPIIKDSNFRVG